MVSSTLALLPLPPPQTLANPDLVSIFHSNCHTADLKCKAVTTINGNIRLTNNSTSEWWPIAPSRGSLPWKALHFLVPALSPITLCPWGRSHPTTLLLFLMYHTSSFSAPCPSTAPSAHCLHAWCFLEHNRNSAPGIVQLRPSPLPTPSQPSTWLTPNHPLRHTSNFL